MGDLETLVEEGPPKSLQPSAHREVCSSSWRICLRRLLPEGFERHRVADKMNDACLWKSSSDASFNRFLMVAFLILTSLVLTQILILGQVFNASRASPFEPPLSDHIFVQTWLYGHFQIEQTGIVFVAILASLLTVGVFAKKMRKKTCSGRPRREEVQTICAHVQQV